MPSIRSSESTPVVFMPHPIPVDIVHAVLEQLDDRRDLHAAALASWDFNRAATPLLYRTLDSDTRTKGRTKEVSLTRPMIYSYHRDPDGTVP